MSENEYLVVDVYNSYGEDVSLKNKRVHSSVDFKCKCPNCNEETIIVGNDFLYVPESFPHVHFYCEKCTHEDKLFFLDKLENNKAYLIKNSLISDIEIYIDTSAVDGDKIIVPVYNTYNIPLSLENKRLHTDVNFLCFCPNCQKEAKTSGQDFLYVPSKFPHVHFYCSECEYSNLILFLEKLEDGMAHFKKNNLFGEIKLF